MRTTGEVLLPCVGPTASWGPSASSLAMLTWRSCRLSRTDRILFRRILASAEGRKVQRLCLREKALGALEWAQA